MKTIPGIYLFVATYLLFAIAMFLLPVITIPGYRITVNTVSELGALSSPDAWIINVLLAALALGAVFMNWGVYKGFVFQRILLSVFGLTLILSVLINHAPAGKVIQYKAVEDGWHSYFIGTAVLSFIILSVSEAYMCDKKRGKGFSVLAGSLVIILSILMSETKQFAGIWQRLMYLIIFGWMIFNVIINRYIE